MRITKAPVITGAFLLSLTFLKRGTGCAFARMARTLPPAPNFLKLHLIKIADRAECAGEAVHLRRHGVIAVGK